MQRSEEARRFQEHILVGTSRLAGIVGETMFEHLGDSITGIALASTSVLASVILHCEGIGFGMSNMISGILIHLPYFQATLFAHEPRPVDRTATYPQY